MEKRGNEREDIKGGIVIKIGNERKKRMKVEAKEEGGEEWRLKKGKVKEGLMGKEREGRKGNIDGSRSLFSFCWLSRAGETP